MDLIHHAACVVNEALHLRPLSGNVLTGGWPC
jgi:hypothetical protein